MDRPVDAGLYEGLSRLGFGPEGAHELVLREDDGSRVVVEVKRGLRSQRDLLAAITQVARHAAEGNVSQACLVLPEHRMSAPTLLGHWTATLALFRKPIRKQLDLVAFDDAGTLLESTTEIGRKIGQALVNSRESWASSRRPADSTATVLQVLLLRWLQHQEPISRKAVQGITGLSYPTVAKALANLHPYLTSGPNRSVALASFPQTAWTRLLVSQRQVRRSAYYRDRTGSPDPDLLLDRVQAHKPAGVAVGGVHGALHADLNFDLRGTPRLDLCVHAPSGEANLDFVARLDPALEPVSSPEQPPVLAVHTLHRHQSLFTDGLADGVFWADPVQVLLDLNDMRLTQQAEELIEHLRARDV